MALKLRRRTGMFTKGILSHRSPGHDPESSGAGAGSFKRVLDDGIFGLDVAKMRFKLRQTMHVSKGIKKVLEEDDPYPGAILRLQKPGQELLCGRRESCVGAGD